MFCLVGRFGFLWSLCLILSALSACKISEEKEGGEVSLGIELKAPSPVNEGNVKSYSFRGLCSPEKALIRYTVGRLEGETSCSGGLFSFEDIDLSFQPEGNFVLALVIEKGEGLERKTLDGNIFILKDTVPPASPVLFLKSPTSSPGSDATPTLSAIGLKFGEGLTLHKEADCNDAPLGRLTAKASSEDITSSLFA